MNIEKELQNAIETANKANEAVLELKKKYEESLKPKVWKPKHGDIVWYTYKSFKGFEPVWGAMSWDSWLKPAYEFGEIFPTEEACQKWIDKTLATQRIKNKILELNDGWEPDWKDTQQDKCRIYYACEYERFTATRSHAYKYEHGLPYIKSQYDAQWIIDNMQDDLKIVFDIS